MLLLIFYYIFTASLILFYGVGVNRLVPLQKSSLLIAKSVVKNLLVTESTTAITFVIVKFILLPLGLYELYTFAGIIIFIPVSLGISIIINTGSRDITEDFAVPLLITFISLNESINILEALVIALSCTASFYMFVLIVWAMHRRFSLYSSNAGIKSYCIILFSMAAVVMALCSVNASWLTLGLNTGL